MGASAANVARVEGIAIRRVRQIIADVLAEREFDPAAGFVPLPVARLGDAMVVAHTMMMEGDLQATEYRRGALVSPFAARSKTGQKTAPKSLMFHNAGHGSACRDLSPHDGARLMPSQSPPTVSLAAVERALAVVSTARRKIVTQTLDIALSGPKTAPRRRRRAALMARGRAPTPLAGDGVGRRPTDEGLRRRAHCLRIAPARRSSA